MFELIAASLWVVETRRDHACLGRFMKLVIIIWELQYFHDITLSVKFDVGKLAAILCT